MTNKLQLGQVLIVIGFVVSVVYFTLNLHETSITGIVGAFLVLILPERKEMEKLTS